MTQHLAGKVTVGQPGAGTRHLPVPTAENGFLLPQRSPGQPLDQLHQGLVPPTELCSRSRQGDPLTEETSTLGS